MNCSLGPKEAMPIVEEIMRWTSVPVLIRPNAGLPDPKTNLYDITPGEYAAVIGEMSELGVKLFGGCCGTTPEFIKAVCDTLRGKKFAPKYAEIPPAICSASETVKIDTVRIIGERINPTGKKLFKEALKRRDLDYIMRQAIEQTEAGADILDVNVGLPDIDEKEMMIAAVNAVQSVCGAPLQIDTTEPDVLEAALRLVSGKPIVNSVNGEEEKLETVLPLVKKYGAAVVYPQDSRGALRHRGKDTEPRAGVRHSQARCVYRLPYAYRLGGAGGGHGDHQSRAHGKGAPGAQNRAGRIKYLVRAAEQGAGDLHVPHYGDEQRA